MPLSLAPVLILVFQQQDGLCQTGDTLSIGAALEHMCLRAQELGLGALWILDTCYTQEDICRYVGSSELELCCALCVGYAAEAPEARPRMELSELMVPVGGDAAADLEKETP